MHVYGMYVLGFINEIGSRFLVIQFDMFLWIWIQQQSIWQFDNTTSMLSFKNESQS